MMVKNQSIIDNSALFSGFFAFKKSPDSRLSKEDLETLRNDIDKKLGEKNAGYAPILPPGMEWEQLKYADAYDPTNLQVYMTMEIAQVFGIPSVMLENGRRTAAFSVNYKEARLHFWEDTILPLIKRITSAFEYFFRKRFLDDEIWIEPDLSKVHVFNDKNVERMLALDKVGFLSMEEKRQLSGMVEEAELCSRKKQKLFVESQKGEVLDDLNIEQTTISQEDIKIGDANGKTD
jgi:HK97 family phage portal protein